LDSTFSERAYGCFSFSDFVDRLKKGDLINVSGSGGRVIIERKSGSLSKPLPQPEGALPMLREVLENHRLELEAGESADQLAHWMQEENPGFDVKNYGYQEFSEFLNYAQDKTVVKVEPHEDRGLVVYLGAEFYPPAEPVKPAEETPEEEDDG